MALKVVHKHVLCVSHCEAGPGGWTQWAQLAESQSRIYYKQSVQNPTEVGWNRQTDKEQWQVYILKGVGTQLDTGETHQGGSGDHIRREDKQRQEVNRPETRQASEWQNKTGNDWTRKNKNMTYRIRYRMWQSLMDHIVQDKKIYW